VGGVVSLAIDHNIVKKECSAFKGEAVGEDQVIQAAVNRS